MKFPNLVLLKASKIATPEAGDKRASKELIFEAIAASQWSMSGAIQETSSMLKLGAQSGIVPSKDDLDRAIEYAREALAQLIAAQAMAEDE